MVENVAYWQAGIRRYGSQAIRIGSGPSNVCGEVAEYFLEKPGASLRENCCSKCGATRAVRDLAQVVLETRGLDRYGSLAAQRGALAGISILAMPAGGKIHHMLQGLPGYECVALTAVESAATASGPKERIKSLLLDHPDDHFGLVISEDILHLFEDPSSALLEIARVLKPDGHHVFTVPIVERCTPPARAREAAVSDPQRPFQVLPEGIPAVAGSAGYTDFGDDLTAAVGASGMNLEIACFTLLYPPLDALRATDGNSGHGPEIGGGLRIEHSEYPYKNSIVFRSRKNGKINRHTDSRNRPYANGRLTGKELILHIGTPKTGTSYLQSFFAKNAGELSAKGIHYPEMISIKEAAAGVATSSNAFVLTRSLLDKKDSRKITGPAAEAAWSKFERVLDGSPHFKILLSSEYFYIAPKEAYAKIREACDRKGYRCRVIVYMRRQDHFLQSQYAQYVKKAAGNQTVEQFCEEHSGLGVFQYLKRLNLIADVIGIENCTVRPYEKDQFQRGNIGSDVLHALGVRNNSRFILSDSLIKKSPSPLELEILRYINANNPAPSWQFSLGLIRALQQANPEEPRSGSGLISLRFDTRLPRSLKVRTAKSPAATLDGRTDGCSPSHCRIHPVPGFPRCAGKGADGGSVVQ